jgi:hypothetical protein
MSLARLKPRYQDGACSVELVDHSTGRRVELQADFKTRQLQVRVSDHVVSARMAIGATVPLSGLDGFFALAQRCVQLYDDGAKVVTADELVELVGSDETIDHTPTQPRRRK